MNNVLNEQVSYADAEAALLALGSTLRWNNTYLPSNCITVPYGPGCYSIRLEQYEHGQIWQVRLHFSTKRSWHSTLTLAKTACECHHLSEKWHSVPIDRLPTLDKNLSLLEQAFQTLEAIDDAHFHANDVSNILYKERLERASQRAEGRAKRRHKAAFRSLGIQKFSSHE